MARSAHSVVPSAKGTSACEGAGISRAEGASGAGITGITGTTGASGGGVLPPKAAGHAEAPRCPDLTSAGGRHASP